MSCTNHVIVNYFSDTSRIKFRIVDKSFDKLLANKTVPLILNEIQQKDFYQGIGRKSMLTPLNHRYLLLYLIKVCY